MNRKQKLQRIQTLSKRLDAIIKERELPLPDFVGKMLDDDASSAQERAKESASSRAILRLAREVDVIKKDTRLDELKESFTRSGEETNTRFDTVSGDFAEKLAAISQEISAAETRSSSLSEASIHTLHEQLISLKDDIDLDRDSYDSRAKTIESSILEVRESVLALESSSRGEIGRTNQEIASTAPIAVEALSTATEAKTAATEANEAIEELRRRLNSRIGNHGNGNMNRNIAIGGNQQALNRYNDINLKAGSNVTITYQNNDATGFLDVTISATGGGGGSGINREINNISTNTAAGSTTDIDYVYLVSGNTTVTLPTAAGNENLYTIKNVGSGTVTINTTGGQIIDGDTSVIMPIQYTSVDIISNGTNWAIT